MNTETNPLSQTREIAGTPGGSQSTHRIAVTPALMFGAFPHGVIFSGRDERIAFWNPAAEGLFGYAAPEAVGSPLHMLLPPAYVEGHVAGYARVMAEGVMRLAPSGPLPMMHKSGEQIMVDLRGELLLDEAGAALGILSFCKPVEPDSTVVSNDADQDQSVATIELRADGPLFVAGRTTIVDEGGAVIRTDERLVLCRCGGAADKPFCDGTHRRIGFVAPPGSAA